MPLVPMPRERESELRDTLRIAAHDSTLRLPRRKMGEHACCPYLLSLPRDEGREPDAGAGAPAAVPAPPRPDGVQDEPMDAWEASRKRRAEDAGHEADDAGREGAQPDPGSMVDDSMPGLKREAEALGADAVALAEAYSSASRQRAGAF